MDKDIATLGFLVIAVGFSFCFITCLHIDKVKDEILKKIAEKKEEAK